MQSEKLANINKEECFCGVRLGLSVSIQAVVSLAGPEFSRASYEPALPVK
jgi:hypothetical protein